MADNVPVAFLLANWYSGATLLTLLLDKHPEVVSNGEGFYHRFRTGDTVCSCGSSVRSCPFYRDAAAGMWNGSDYDDQLFSVTPPLLNDGPVRSLLQTSRLSGRWRRVLIRSVPSLRRRYDGFLQAHVEFMRKALSLKGARLYLDGTKSLRRAEIFLSEEGFRTSPLLLLVRHPLSWCPSWLEKEKTVNLDNAIRTWKEYVRLSLRLSQRFPAAPLRIVRYEELCSNPTGEMANIQRWLGLQGDSVSTETQLAPHILGNNMRFSFDGEVRPATDRSHELSSAQRTQIVRHCRQWMEAVGYSAQ